MTRLALLTAGVLVLAVVALGAASAARPAEGASATGGFTYAEFNQFGLRTWVGALSAHGWLDDSHGVIHLNFDGVMNARGSVTCLYVSGNDAWLSGAWTRGTGIDLPYFELHVVDDGKNDAWRSGSSIFPLSGANHCGADFAGSAPLPTSAGNIVVRQP